MVEFHPWLQAKPPHRPTSYFRNSGYIAVAGRPASPDAYALIGISPEGPNRRGSSLWAMDWALPRIL